MSQVVIVLPAPGHYPRWMEWQIAGMVGKEIEIDGVVMRVVRAGPLDGSPEEGANRMSLTVEPV